MKEGDRVRHQNARKSFGEGVIVRIVPGGTTVHVRWDTWRINVPYGGWGNDVSGVNISSLTVIADAADPPAKRGFA